MPCGKRPLIKNWEKPKNMKFIKPSKYEKNEASVKLHWKSVMRSLEASYKDDQFWESQYDTVRNLLNPVMFHRITKIFHLPSESKNYEPLETELTPVPSEKFYDTTLSGNVRDPCSRIRFSVFDFQRQPSELQTREQSEHWTVSSHRTSEYRKLIRSKSTIRSKSKDLRAASKSTARSFPKFAPRRSQTQKSKDRGSDTSDNTPPESDDDLKVHPSEMGKKLQSQKNPHYEFLYCNESEADMIKWNSKFIQKGFEVSASDQFNKKAEIATKKVIYTYN